MLFSILFRIPDAKATHIVGGELNYRYLGNNVYEIRLTVYRDCFNGIPAFDNPASVGVFDAFNNLVTEIRMVFKGSDTIPSAINNPCFIPPANICYEHTTYIDSVVLPPSSLGYQLAYQRCCRNYTIANIVSPDNTGATYYATIPGTSTFSQNGNPVFKDWPPPFICAGLPFVFDHSATDPDGDSISYELCVPFNGADTIIPTPQPPNAPPYADVIFKAPYNLGNLLGGTPLQIDPVTGLLTAIPATIGQFVVGICAREFRNGIYVGVTKRDFQLNVVPCPTLIVAALQYPLITCGSNAVQFVNQSYNAGSYLWDFGLPGNTDTSTAFSPSFTYPDTGSYVVTLVAYSGFNPNCTDTTTGTVQILPAYLTDYTYTRNPCTNEIIFIDSSNTDAGPTTSWQWDFDDGTSSNIHNPVHQFQPGTYTVTLVTTSQRGCRQTISKIIVVPPLITASVQPTSVSCNGLCDGTANASVLNGTLPLSYQWNDSLIQNTQLATGLCAGNYSVTVTDSNGCITNADVIVNEPSPLVVEASVIPAYCGGRCIGSALSVASGGNGSYQYQWNDSLAQQTAEATGLCTGNYSVTVTDLKGCSATHTVSIIYSDSLPDVNASADTTDIYEGQSVSLHASPQLNYILTWQPVSSLQNASSANPVATPPGTTTYEVFVTDPNQCTNSDTVTIRVLNVICTEPEIYIPNAFSPDGDHVNDVFRIRGNTFNTMHLVIYDRWGEKVFETNNYREGWDGIYKGKAAEPGVYMYYVELTCFDKSTFFHKGNVTLLR